MLRLYMDVHVKAAITAGLRRRDTDVVTAQADGGGRQVCAGSGGGLPGVGPRGGGESDRVSPVGVNDLIKGRVMSSSSLRPANTESVQARFVGAHDWVDS
jgi:hypothetical protein